MWQDDGFFKGEKADVQVSLQRLATLMKMAYETYTALSTQELTRQPAPGKWSKQQVLGHLIDSAINNLKRFTDAQIMEQPYHLISYDQEGLMEVNHYNELPIEHLLGLWQSLNQQIIFVAERIPETILAYPIDPQYEKTGTKNLAWLICDYVAHMEHHFHSILFIS